MRGAAARLCSALGRAAAPHAPAAEAQGVRLSGPKGHRMRWVQRGSFYGFLSVLLGGAPLHSQEAVTFDVGIDHIILVAKTLTGGIDVFSRLPGVAPTRAGQHPA